MTKAIVLLLEKVVRGKEFVRDLAQGCKHLICFTLCYNVMISRGSKYMALSPYFVLKK